MWRVRSSRFRIARSRAIVVHSKVTARRKLVGKNGRHQEGDYLLAGITYSALDADSFAKTVG
jgi:hypothetical protein